MECPTSWQKISVCGVAEGAHLLDDWAEGRPLHWVGPGVARWDSRGTAFSGLSSL